MDMSDKIQVAIKVRPLISRERDENLPEQWIIHENSLRPVNAATSESYIFDHVFGTSATNEHVYNKVVSPITEAAVRGFNGTVFAYGQTASGKTYTMMGSKTECGIMELVINDIFKLIGNFPNRTFFIRANFIEIYNEKVYDLLERGKPKVPIKLHEDATGKVLLNNVKYKMISTPQELMDVIRLGEKYRQTGETNMNERSSRSHTIFRIVVESRLSDDDPEDGLVQVSHLDLVDLAGSERICQTGATGTRLKEGTHINKSLLTLSLVIKQLSEMNDNSNRYINFRDSKLTRILQPSLGGNAKTLIICAITPTSLEESQSTLAFASRAKVIKNKPEVNEIISSDALLKRYAKQISQLREELERTKSANTRYTSQEEENRRLQERILLLQKFMLQPRVVTPTRHSSVIDVTIDKTLRRQTWGGSAKNLFPFRSRVQKSSILFSVDEEKQNFADEAIKIEEAVTEKSFVSGENFNCPDLESFDPSNSVLLKEKSANMNISVPMEEFELELIESLKENINESGIDAQQPHADVVESENLKNASYRLSNEDQQDDKRYSNSDVEELKTELTFYKTQLEAHKKNQTDVEKLADELVQYKTQLEEYKQSKRDADAKMEKLSSELFHYKSQYERLQSESALSKNVVVEELRSELRHYQMDLKKYEKINTEMNCQMEGLRRDSVFYKTQYEQQQKNIQDICTLMEELKSNLEYYRTKYTELQQSRSLGPSDDIQKLQSDVVYFQTQFEELRQFSQDESNIYKDTIKVLEEEITQMKHKNVKLQDEINLLQETSPKRPTLCDATTNTEPTQNFENQTRKTIQKPKNSKKLVRYRPKLDPIVEPDEDIETVFNYFEEDNKDWCEVGNLIHDRIQDIILLQTEIGRLCKHVDFLEMEQVELNQYIVQINQNYKQMSEEFSVQGLQREIPEESKKYNQLHADFETMKFESSNITYHTETNKLGEKLVQLRHENEQLKKEKTLENEKYKKLLADFEAMKTESSSIPDHIETNKLRDELVQLKHENEQLKKEKTLENEKHKKLLAEFEAVKAELSSIADQKEMNMLREELVQLKHENEQLKKEKSVENEKYKELLVDFEAIKAELLSIAHQKETNKLHEELVQLRHENDQLKKEKTVENGKYKKLLAEFETVKVELSSIAHQKETNKLHEELVQLRHENEQLKKENTLENEKYKKLLVDFEAIKAELLSIADQKEMNMFREELVQLRYENNQLKKEKTLENGKYKKLLAEFEAVKAELSSIADQREMNMLREELAQLKHENEQLKKAKSVENEKYKKLLVDFEAIKAELSSIAHQKETNKLHEELVQLRHENYQLKKEKTVENGKYKKLLAEFEAVKAELSNIAHQKETNKLHEELVQLRHENDQFKKEKTVENGKYKKLLAEFEAVKVELSSIADQKEMNMLREELVPLRHENDQLKKEKTLENEKYKKLLADFEAIKAQLSSIPHQKETNKLREQLLHLKDENEQLKKEKTLENEKYNKLLADFEAMKAELSSIANQKEMNKLREQLLHLKDENEQLKKEKTLENEKYNKLLEDFETMKVEPSSITDHIETNKLYEELVQIKHETDKLKKEKTLENEKYTKLLENFNGLRKELRSKNEKIQELINEKTILEQQCVDFSQKLNSQDTRNHQMIDRLQKEKHKLTQDILEIQQRTELMAEQFTTQINNLKIEKSNENQKYKTLLETFNQTSKKLEDFKNENCYYNDQNSKLCQEKSDLEKQCKDLTQQLNKLNSKYSDEIERVKDEKHLLKQNSIKNEQTYKQLIEDYETQLNQFKKENSEVTQKYKTLQENYEKKIIELTDLKQAQNLRDKQIQQLKDQNCQLEKQCHQYLEQLKTITTKNIDQSKIDHLQAENHQLKESNIELEKKFKNFQNINREIQNERNQIQEKYNQLLEKHQKTEQNQNLLNQEATQQNDTLKNELLKKIDTLEKENAALASKLEKFTAPVTEQPSKSTIELPVNESRSKNYRKVDIYLLEQEIDDLKIKCKNQTDQMKHMRFQWTQAEAKIKQMKQEQESKWYGQKRRVLKVDQNVQVNLNQESVDTKYYNLKNAYQKNSLKISELQAQCDQLSQENQQLREQALKLNKNPHPESAMSQKSQTDQYTQTDETITTINNLESQIANLKTELLAQNNQNTSPETQKVDSQPKPLSELQIPIQNSLLNTVPQHTCTCGAAKKVRELNSKLEMKNYSYDDLKSTLNSVQRQLKRKAIECKTLSQDYQLKLDIAQDKNQQLQATIDSTKQKVAVLEGKLKRYESTESDVVKLKHKIEALEVQVRDEKRHSAWYQAENEQNIKKIHELEDKIEKMNVTQQVATPSPKTMTQKNRRLSSSKRNEMIDHMRRIDEQSLDAENVPKPLAEIQNIGKENKGIQCPPENSWDFATGGSGIVTTYHKDQEIHKLKKLFWTSKQLCQNRLLRIQELEAALNLKPGEKLPAQ